MGKCIKVKVVPKCDFCDEQAYADGKTIQGPWANMCKRHFDMIGVGLGTGRGQMYVLDEKEEKGAK